MASKKDQIDVLNLSEYAQEDAPQEFSVSHLCSIAPVFLEHQEAPHRHDFYTIYWIKKGELTHTIDTVTHTVKKNTLFFLAPGQVHQLKSSEKIDGYMIAFHNCMMCPAGSSDMDPIKNGLFVNDAFSSVVHITDPAVEKEIDWLVLRMEEEVNARRPNYDSAFRNLLQYFLIVASRNAPKPVSLSPEYQSKHNSALFMTFKGLIEQQYKELKNVSDYAALLHIKPVLLNEISKQLSGITAGEHIRNRVILEAQRYLFNTDLTAKEIAYTLGFDDPHYFSRFFKKYTNQTPSEFKELAKA